MERSGYGDMRMWREAAMARGGYGERREHVDCVCVLLRAQQQLGRPIPASTSPNKLRHILSENSQLATALQSLPGCGDNGTPACDDVARHHLRALGHLAHPRQPEVADLEVTVLEPNNSRHTAGLTSSAQHHRSGTQTLSLGHLNMDRE